MENTITNPESINGVLAPEGHDISMTDAPVAQQAPPAQPPLQQPPTTSALSTTAIPVPQQQQQTQPQQQQQPTSRAPSQHPELATTTSGPTPATATVPTTTTGPTGPTMPTEAIPHGAPVRQYINSKITGVLLEGMKIVAREQPKDPLRVLGEFLLQRSKELEGKDGAPGSGS